MISPINIALSGLQAASRRLENSANNVANISSTGRIEKGVHVKEPFVPQQVSQISDPNGGVRTELRPVDPASVSIPDADNASADENGITQYPNVNLEEEVVNQITAGYDFKANLKVIKTADATLKSLLNIIS